MDRTFSATFFTNNAVKNGKPKIMPVTVWWAANQNLQVSQSAETAQSSEPCRPELGCVFHIRIFHVARGIFSNFGQCRGSIWVYETMMVDKTFSYIYKLLTEKGYNNEKDTLIV
jgi:hypothetical protein